MGTKDQKGSQLGASSNDPAGVLLYYRARWPSDKQTCDELALIARAIELKFMSTGARINCHVSLVQAISTSDVNVRRRGKDLGHAVLY